MTVDSFAAQISLVVPVKGDFHGLVRLLEQIRNWQIEIIVVEAIAEVAADAPVVINPQREQSMKEVRRREGLWLQHSPSRGAQIRHGIEQASSPWLWVLMLTRTAMTQPIATCKHSFRKTLSVGDALTFILQALTGACR